MHKKNNNFIMIYTNFFFKFFLPETSINSKDFKVCVLIQDQLHERRT